MADELGKAVEIMGTGKNGIGFGKVDITIEKELQEEFDIKEAPELKLFFEGNRLEPISCKGNSYLFIYLFIFVFLGPHLQHKELPSLGVKSELQPLAYTTTTAMPDPSHLFDLHHSSWQLRIPNPLIQARDQTCVLVDTGQICFH